MIVYLILLLSTCLLSIISLFVFRNKEKGFLIRKIIIVSYFFTFLYILASLKSNSVGNDTPAYFDAYANANSNAWFNFNGVGFEWGFSFLMQLFSKCKLPFTVFLFFINVPIYFSIAYLFIKKTPYPTLSCLLYFFFSLFIFNFSALRQSLAIALFIFAYLILSKKQSIKNYIFYGLLFVAALLIHTSSIVFVIIPLAINVKNNKKVFPLLIIIPLIVFVFSEYIYGFIFYYIASQATYAPGSYGGGGLFFLLVALFVFAYCLVYFPKITDKPNSFLFGKEEKSAILSRSLNLHQYQTKDYFSMIVMLFTAIVFQSFTRTNVNFPRFGFFFIPFLFVLLPQAIVSQKSKTIRVILYLLLVAFFAVYFVVYVVHGDSLNTIPYHFVFEG